MRADKLYPPIHPGEILMTDFIEGFGIMQNKLAVSIGVPPRRINQIVLKLPRMRSARRSPDACVGRGCARATAGLLDQAYSGRC